MSKHKVEIELGAWGLPANSQESLSLPYTVAELTQLMRENSAAISRQMQLCKVEAPLHQPISPATLKIILD